ncbi:hypothetical protein [Thermosulfurimonas sp. F29]|uniref:hypothetical protein n=1 Tax=Thermosulfurimonas sp. F29 TaxID=2867247 RepID=UPI001C834A3E|nr:hypothetical protein [Thermosulfurimonas sp. F29]MBX6423286.1 hypothetical protein [Thermosulfurimonas sp. F29]
MRRMLRTVLTVLALGLFLAGGTPAGTLKKYMALYGTYLNYGNSRFKEDGYALTAYGSFGDGLHHGVEAAVSQLHLNYDSGYNDLDQTDLTLAYTNTGSLHPNLSLRVGGHYISSDDDLTDDGKIVFGDLTYLVPYRWNVGLEVAYSDYHRGVDVLQFSPHAGYFLKLGERSLYLEARGYYINLDENEKLGLSMENYYSLELSATCTRGPLSVKLSGWAGQQVFAVKRAGFVVYNLTEKYRGGVTGEVTYRYRKKYVLGLTASWNTYKEIESEKAVNQSVLTAFFGFNF